MKLIIKDFPGDEGKQSLTYKKKNKLFSMGKALYQLLDSFFWSAKALGWTRLQIINVGLKVMLEQLEMVTPENYSKYRAKAYELPQELGDKLWKLRNDYFKKKSDEN